jgi:hypothetical protein
MTENTARKSLRKEPYRRDMSKSTNDPSLVDVASANIEVIVLMQVEVMDA